MPDVGRKAARRAFALALDAVGLSRKTLARSLACRRKVDNVARVAIVIGLPGEASSVARARARVCLGFTRSRTPFSRAVLPQKGCSGLKRLRPTHVRG